MIEPWRVERWRKDVLLMLQPKRAVSAGKLVAAHTVSDHRTPYTAIIRVLRALRGDGLVVLAPGGRGWALTHKGVMERTRILREARALEMRVQEVGS